MDDKLSREAAISAKIAAIRAANEERERRHAEVEADKKLAIKKKSAVDTRNVAGPEGSSMLPGEIGLNVVSPPKSAGNVRRGGVERVVPPSTRISAQDRLKKDQDTAVKPRIAGSDKNGPPPDPGYR
jgi:hypothetical protein